MFIELSRLHKKTLLNRLKILSGCVGGGNNDSLHNDCQTKVEGLDRGNHANPEESLQLFHPAPAF